jgi:hypothetical protein
MRPYPAGWRDASMPTMANLSFVAAGFIVAFAIGAFGFRTWVFFSWPRTNGLVTSSDVATQLSDNGTVMCSAVESVHYFVDGQSRTTESGGNTFTSNCKKVEERVTAARGQNRIVSFNKSFGTVYLNPGWTVSFYGIPILLTSIAAAVAVFGWIQLKIYGWMVRRKIQLP